MLQGLHMILVWGYGPHYHSLHMKMQDPQPLYL